MSQELVKTKASVCMKKNPNTANITGTKNINDIVNGEFSLTKPKILTITVFLFEKDVNKK